MVAFSSLRGYLESPTLQMRIDYSFVKRSVIKGFEKLSEGWEASAERDLCCLGAEMLSESATGWIGFVSGVSAQTNIFSKTFISLY